MPLWSPPWDFEWTTMPSPFVEDCALVFPYSAPTSVVSVVPPLMSILLYSHLQSTHTFVAVETTGAFGTESPQFLKHLGSRLRSQSGNPSAYQQLIQRLSVAVQRGNAMAIYGSL